MKRELNKIFDVQSREARRDILDKFDLSADDKNKVLSKIDSGNGNEGVIDSTIYYRVKEDFGRNFETSVGNEILPFCVSASAFVFYDNNNNLVEELVNSPFYLNDINAYHFTLAFMPINYPKENLVFNSLEEAVDKGIISSIDWLERCDASEFYSSKKIYKFKIYITKDIYTGTPPIVGEYNRAVREYEFEIDMSFDDWLNSKYNVDNLTKIIEDGITYIIAPYVSNGEKVANLVGHSYNPIVYDTPYMFRFFQNNETQTDEGVVITQLYFNTI